MAKLFHPTERVIQPIRVKTPWSGSPLEALDGIGKNVVVVAIRVPFARYQGHDRVVVRSRGRKLIDVKIDMSGSPDASVYVHRLRSGLVLWPGEPIEIETRVAKIIVFDTILTREVKPSARSS